ILHWDYHFWLQRGSLELESGSVYYADRYLNTAYSLASGDELVVTAYAYMLMKKAAASPQAEDAEQMLAEGQRLLRGQIALRGRRDDYPYHVLGAQALAWANRCGWPRQKKQEFLNAAKRDVQAGLRFHPRSDVLQQLALDLQQKVIAVGAGLS